MAQDQVVFLFDVDNTLLDNDQVSADRIEKFSSGSWFLTN